MAAPRQTLNAQLTPIFSQDIVTPGVFYFALLEDGTPFDVRSWWIVLRCPEESLPQPFRDSKEASSRAFPFFVLGQSRFVWLERDALHLLHPSQKVAYAQTDVHAEFCDYYDLAVGTAKSDPLTYFERDIVEAGNRFLADRTKIINRTRLSHTRPQSPFGNCVDHNLFFEESENPDNTVTRSVKETGSVKRQKRSRQAAETSDIVLLSTMHSPTPKLPSVSLTQSNVQSPHPQQAGSQALASSRAPIVRQKLIGQRLPPNFRSFSVASHQPVVRIKTEAEAQQYEYGRKIEAADKISIILGNGRPFPTSRVAINKSPILAAQIQHDAKKGAYVMHPELSEADPSDVLALLDFMQSGQYHPRRCARPDKQAYGSMALAGKTQSWEYSEELVRAGRLYLLAKSLQVEGMLEHILDKITTTEYRPYSQMALMQLCVGIFSEPGGSSRNSRDPLEAWIITMTAGRFREINMSHSERDYFWQVLERRTAARKLVRDIFAKCAENYHVLGGIPVDLTLDD